MWPQLHALLLLRWYLFKNTMLRSKHLYFLLLPILLILGLFGILFLIGAGFVGGKYVFDVQHPLRTLFVLDIPVVIVLYLWFLSIAMEIQFHRVVDLRSLGYLPVHLLKLFLLNFAQFHMNLIMILYATLSLGLVAALGLLLGVKGFCLGIVLLLACYAMISAWSYFLQGWLHHMMNERFVQLLMTLMGFFFMIPYFIGMFIGDLEIDPEDLESLSPLLENAPSSLPQLLHAVIPLGWMPLGMYYVLLGHFLLPLACVAGLACATAPGLWLAYRHTRTLASGQVKRRNATRPAKEKSAQGAPLTIRSLPWISEELSAVTIAVGLCFWRNSRLKWSALSSFLFLGIFFAFMFSNSGAGESQFISNWNYTLIIPMCMFGCMVMLNNVFGTDGDGFNALVLLPGARWHYLCAYNLVFSIFTVAIGAIVMLTMMGLGMASVGETLLGLMLLLQAYLMVSCVGNYFSILVPYRMEPQKMMQGLGGFKMVFFVYFQLAIFALGMLPIVACFAVYKMENTGLTSYAVSPAFLLATFLLLATTFMYMRFGLKHCGQLLQEREQKVVAMLGISTE